MHLVEKALARPMRCAVLPYQHDDPRGFWDCGVLPGLDPHVYVSQAALGELAARAGFVRPDEHRLVVGELERANRRVAQLEDEIADLNRDFEAIDLLESRGYRARRKPGRKKEVVDG